MNWRRIVRKTIKYGPWNYRFWRELARFPYNYFLRTPAVVDVLPNFPAAAELRESFAAVKTEAMAVAMREDVPANHEIMKHQRTFYDHDKIVWGMVPLRAYGYDYPKNMSRLPTLSAFLKRHPDVVSATISVFPPGKHLRPHKGPFKGVWRYHLVFMAKPLAAERTACELTIDGRTYWLKEGDDLLWDDTFMHDARNDSDEPRVVLLLDVMRADQPWPLRGLSNVACWMAQLGQMMMGTRARAEIG